LAVAAREGGWLGSGKLDITVADNSDGSSSDSTRMSLEFART